DHFRVWCAGDQAGEEPPSEFLICGIAVARSQKKLRWITDAGEAQAAFHEGEEHEWGGAHQSESRNPFACGNHVIHYEAASGRGMLTPPGIYDQLLKTPSPFHPGVYEAEEGEMRSATCWIGSLIFMLPALWAQSDLSTIRGVA